MAQTAFTPAELADIESVRSFLHDKDYQSVLPSQVFFSIGGSEHTVFLQSQDDDPSEYQLVIES